VADSEEASQPVEWGGEVIALARDGVPRMQRHAHVQGSRRIGPRLRLQCPLRLECRGDGAGSGGESRLDRITHRLEQHAAMSRDGSTKKGEVALDSSRHRRPILLPERGAACDVGEEEGDGAARQLRHCWSPGSVSGDGAGNCPMRAITERERQCGPGSTGGARR
jgi:hypothetical protein